MRVIPNKNLDREDAERLIGALDIAYTEVGDFEYQNMMTKLYSLFPSILLEERERDAKSHQNGVDQSKARIANAHLFFEQVDLTKPVLVQLQSLFCAYMEFKDENGRNDLPLDEYILDHVCLAGDLFRYHRKALVKAGILKEMQEIVDENENDDYSYEAQHMKNNRDNWFVLNHIFEKSDRAMGDFNRNDLSAPCEDCGGKRDKKGQRSCKKCYAEWKKQHEEKYPTRTKAQRKIDDADSRKEYEAKWDEIKKERDEIISSIGGNSS